jgi:F0F1-type ATP synthase membrane subunit b/b'
MVVDTIRAGFTKRIEEVREQIIKDAQVALQKTLESLIENARVELQQEIIKAARDIQINVEAIREPMSPEYIVRIFINEKNNEPI